MTLIGIFFLTLAAIGVTCDVVEHRRLTRERLDISRALRKR